MKLNYNAALVLIAAMAFIALMVEMWIDRPVEKSSSFVGYSQSCWQVGDTLHVVTANGDTLRLDVSKLEDK